MYRGLPLSSLNKRNPAPMVLVASLVSLRGSRVGLILAMTRIYVDNDRRRSMVDGKTSAILSHLTR
jgi:hypothetical protein